MNSSWRWSVLKRTYRSSSILSCAICAPTPVLLTHILSQPSPAQNLAQPAVSPASRDFNFEVRSWERQPKPSQGSAGSGAAWRMRHAVTLVSSAGRVAATAAMSAASDPRAAA